MKNKDVYINCMELNGTPLPSCQDGQQHDFVNVNKPANYRSGWHDDKCTICGLMIGYDDSD